MVAALQARCTTNTNFLTWRFSMPRTLLALGILLLSIPLLAPAKDAKEKMMDNPMYGVWAKHKPGATATVIETTTFSGDEKNPLPDKKVITYTLLSVSDAKAVVKAVVAEQELLGTVESAPTKHIYPAKLKKSYIEAALPDLDAKKGEETIDWQGKPIKCKTLYGSYKKDGLEVDFKAWHNDAVPGGVVKRTRTTKQDGKSITTTVTLQKYKAGK
jgi:hypothetical protein